MLQIRSAHNLHSTRIALCEAVERHGGSVLAAGHMNHLLGAQAGTDAVTLTLCFSALYAPLLNASVRFAAFLPARVAVCSRPDGVFVEAVSPREWCRLLHRPDAETAAAALEQKLLAVMEEAAQIHHRGLPADEVRATEDQVNMRAALPHRIDCHGSKVEELAGTGVLDTQGG